MDISSAAHTTPTRDFPHVLIVGAGIGGLLLAQALRSAGISFEIFDRATDLSSDIHNWPVTIYSIFNEIQAVVPSRLPPIESLSNLSPLNLPAQTRFYYANEDTYLDRSRDESEIIHADRVRLMKWLGTDIPVRWRTNVDKIVEKTNPDGKAMGIELWLNHGKIARGDVLVGADGWDSQVRRCLSPTPPSYNLSSPHVSITGEVEVDGDVLHDQLKLGYSGYNVIPSPTQLSPDAHHLFVALKSVSQDAKSARYYWSITYYENGPARFWIPRMSTAELHENAMRNTRFLDPKFRQIIQVTKTEEMTRPRVIIRDIQVLGMPNSRVTLLGDAAHTFGSYRGEGGFHALQDALNLAKVLTDCNAEDIIDRLRKYQEEMISRGNKAAGKARSRSVHDMCVEDQRSEFTTIYTGDEYTDSER